MIAQRARITRRRRVLPPARPATSVGETIPTSFPSRRTSTRPSPASLGRRRTSRSSSSGRAVETTASGHASAPTRVVGASPGGTVRTRPSVTSPGSAPSGPTTGKAEQWWRSTYSSSTAATRRVRVHSDRVGSHHVLHANAAEIMRERLDCPRRPRGRGEEPSEHYEPQPADTVDRGELEESDGDEHPAEHPPAQAAVTPARQRDPLRRQSHACSAVRRREEPQE